MTKIALTFAGIDASASGYGRTRSCPAFGAGYAAYMFGTSFTSTPTLNLFTGLLDGRIVGNPDAVGLLHGPMATSYSGTITGGNLLTVTGTVLGDPLAVGMTVELATGGTSLGVISSLGTGTGGAGTYNLTGGVNTATSTMRGWTKYFETAGLARDIFNIGGAVTLLAIYKAPLSQSLIGDDITGGNLSMLVPAGSNDIQTFGRDSAAVVVNVSTSSGFLNGATTWTMGVSQFNTTTAQGFMQRSGPARVASALATTRTANPMGITTRKLRTGLYNNVTPASRLAGIAIYTKMLSGAEMDDAFLYWRDILADVGEVM